MAARMPWRPSRPHESRPAPTLPVRAIAFQLSSASRRGIAAATEEAAGGADADEWFATWLSRKPVQPAFRCVEVTTARSRRRSIESNEGVDCCETALREVGPDLPGRAIVAGQQRDLFVRQPPTFAIAGRCSLMAGASGELQAAHADDLRLPYRPNPGRRPSARPKSLASGSSNDEDPLSRHDGAGAALLRVPDQP